MPESALAGIPRGPQVQQKPQIIAVAVNGGEGQDAQFEAAKIMQRFARGRKARRQKTMTLEQAIQSEEDDHRVRQARREWMLRYEKKLQDRFGTKFRPKEKRVNLEQGGRVGSMKSVMKAVWGTNDHEAVQLFRQIDGDPVYDEFGLEVPVWAQAGSCRQVSHSSPPPILEVAAAPMAAPAARRRPRAPRKTDTQEWRGIVGALGRPAMGRGGPPSACLGVDRTLRRRRSGGRPPHILPPLLGASSQQSPLDDTAPPLLSPRRAPARPSRVAASPPPCFIDADLARAAARLGLSPRFPPAAVPAILGDAEATIAEAAAAVAGLSSDLDDNEARALRASLRHVTPLEPRISLSARPHYRHPVGGYSRLPPPPRDEAVGAPGVHTRSMTTVTELPISRTRNPDERHGMPDPLVLPLQRRSPRARGPLSQRALDNLPADLEAYLSAEIKIATPRVRDATVPRGTEMEIHRTSCLQQPLCSV